MEKRISIVHGCLFLFGLGLALCAFSSIWTATGHQMYGGRIWLGVLDGILALVSLGMGTGYVLAHRPHATISTVIGISAVLTVIGALFCTIVGATFFGICNFAAAAAYVGLTVALARDLPTGGSVSIQRAAEEAITHHVAA